MSSWSRVVVVALWMMMSASAARAQDWDVGVEAQAAAGYSDNIQSAPEQSQPGPTADVFYRLRPSITGFYTTPRSKNVAGYALEFFLYQENSNINALTHRGYLRSEMETSQRSELEVELNASLGQANIFLQQSNPESGTLDAVSGGSSDFRSGAVDQSYRWEATDRLRLSQIGTVRLFETTGAGGDVQSRVVTVSAGSGAEYALPRGAVGLSASARYVSLDSATSVSAGEEQVDVGAQARWQRSLAEQWAAAAQAGAVVAIGPAGAFSDRLRAVGAAELAYMPPWGGLSASYQRLSTPNLFLGLNTISDSVSLRLSLPVVAGDDTRPLLSLASSVGHQWGRGIVFETGSTLSEWRTLLADAAVVWSPKRNLSASLRYQYVRQSGDGMIAQDYQRNTLTFVLVTRYGGRQQDPPSVSNLIEREAEEEGQRVDDASGPGAVR